MIKIGASLTRFYLVLSLIFTYAAFKSTQLWPLNQVCAVAFTTLLFAVIIAALFLYRSDSELTETKWFSALIWTAYVLMGFIGTFLILSLPIDFVQIFLRSPALSRAVPVIMFVSSLVFSLIGLFQAVRGPRVTSVAIPISESALRGLKVAQISDLHVGPTIKKKYVTDIVARTNALDADFIFITGDLVDGNTDILNPHLQPLRKLKSKYGIYYVTGNHEYYWQPASLLRLLHEFGFQILINENRIIEIDGGRILIAGITDPAGAGLTGHKPNLEKALSTLGTPDLKILLAHRPDGFEAAEKAGVDIQFSGHTHSGQFFPFSLFMPLAHTYYRGLNHYGRMWIYVNQGSGYWGPANRFATPTEITLATLS